MNIFFPKFWFCFLALIGIYLIVLALGKLVLSTSDRFSDNNNPVLTFFITLLMGTTLSVSIFALIMTKGNSIMWLTAIALLCYCFIRGEKLHFKITLSRQELYLFIASIIVLTLTYILFYWISFIRCDGNIYCDNVYAGDVAYYLLHNNRETTFYHIQATASNYHWGDMWFTAMVSCIFGIKGAYAISVVTYPFFTVLIVFGAFGLIRAINPNLNSISTTIIALAFILTTPIVCHFVDCFGSLSSHPKLYIPEVFLIFALASLLKKDYPSFFLGIMLIVPFNTIISPGVLTFAFILALTKYFIQKERNQQFLKGCLSLVLITIAFALFYFVQKDPAVENTERLWFYGDNIINNTLHYGLTKTIKSILPIIPIVLFYVLYTYKNHRNKVMSYILIILCYAVAAVVSSLIAGYTRQFVLDGRQIIVNYCTCAVLLIILYSIVDITRSSKSSFWTGIITILSAAQIVLYVICDKSEWHQKDKNDEDVIPAYTILKEEFKGQSNPKIGYFRNYYLKQHHNTMTTRNNFSHPMEKIQHIVDSGFYFPECLSVFDFPEDIEPRFDDRALSNLYNFGYPLMNSMTKDEIILSFVKSEDIEYIVVESGAELPEILLDKCRQIVKFSEGEVYKVI